MAKRISSTSINWAGLVEKFYNEDRAKVIKYKTVAEKYLREIASKPAELPKIDWNYYRTRITVPGMVDSFQKSYESLKIPYPSDQGLIAESEKFNEQKLKKFDMKLAEERTKYEKLSKELAEKEKIMPYTEMTLEEFLLARPDQREYFEKPSLWPYGDEAYEEKKDK